MLGRVRVLHPPRSSGAPLSSLCALGHVLYTVPSETQNHRCSLIIHTLVGCGQNSPDGSLLQSGCYIMILIPGAASVAGLER